MKLNLFFIISLFYVLNLSAQKDYIITIDGESYEMELDGSRKIKVKGKSVEIELKKKDTLVLDEDFFQLKYTKKHKVSRVVVEEGIEQLMLITAGGSGIIVQKYDSFNPSMLQEMMLNEVTKESVSYGYTMKREDYEKTLISGEIIKILKAVLEYKGEREIYEIAAHGIKDEGLLIMTMNVNVNLDVEDGGRDLIKLMWNSLRIKK
ncbi:hypothetical protein [Winogradskyella sp. UBA3174]|uniref:hypothetical protein n=1 Tax=Winogradskyella sp. UBA3174 TaxID=1947785 RepID=UPI0025D8B92C|nr:hypothetical protein [Winogradskyella sp. UBA3174]